jgi:hypothetical protein
MVIAVLLIMLPAYRWFFLISVLIGLVIAGALSLWYKRHAIEEPDVHPEAAAWFVDYFSGLLAICGPVTTNC